MKPAAIPVLDTCGNPAHERALVGALAQVPLHWVESSPHEVMADLQMQREVIVLMDQGSARLQGRLGRRGLDCDLVAGSIGHFLPGTHLAASHWRWSPARRVAIDLGAVETDPVLADQRQRLPATTTLAFHDETLARLIRALAREAAAGHPNGSLYAESLLWGARMALHRRTASGPRAARERGRLSVVQLALLTELVHDRLSQRLTVGELAAAVGFSPSQLVRLLKNSTGQTPHVFVQQIRLAQARQRVLGSTVPLVLIAQETGFASQSHMTAAFVRAFGEPPGAMRRDAHAVRLAAAH